MTKKQQRRAWGSVTEAKRGKKYVLRWVEGTPEGRNRKTMTVRGTYRQACEELDRQHARVLEEEKVGCSTSIGYVYEHLWLPDALKRVESGDLKQSTMTMYESAWRNYIEPAWAGVRVDDVKPIKVQEWLDSMSGGSSARSLTVAKMICDMAVNYELADVNKFRAKYRLTQKASKNRADVLTLEEADAALNALKGALMEPPFILMCFGSCRVAESLGVRVSEVEFIENQGETFAAVPIRRQMPRTGAAPMADSDMKNPQSERTVVIPPPYSLRLAEIVSEKKAQGVEWLADRGDRLPMSVSKAVFAWSKESGGACPSGKDVSMQKLRSSWRTIAEVEWGIPDRLCELLMGHKLPGVTGSHYLRPDPASLVENFADAFCSDSKSFRTI